MLAVTFSGNKITVDGHNWKAPYPVKAACVSSGRVVLIYSPEAKVHGGKFHNMEGFTLQGQRLWTAEHPMPETDRGDVYLEFMSIEPLIAWSFACFRCTIDPETGRMLHSEFTK